MQYQLVRTARWRRMDTYAAFMLTIVDALFLTILATTFLGESEVLIKLILIGAAIFLTPIWAITWSQWRLVFGPTGSIELTGSEVIFDSPRWFRQPLRVSLTQIQDVSFEEGNKLGWWDSLELTPLHEEANLTIAFDPPLKIPSKTAKLFPTSRVNLRQRSFLYFLARVENIDNVHAAFSRAGVIERGFA